MKRLAAFLKATTLGGLFVLLPVVVVLGLTGRTVIAVRTTAQAIMQHIVGKESGVAQFPMVFAILIVVGVSFILGLTMISRRGKESGRWIERTLLFRMPGYPALRAIVGGLTNVDRKGVVKPGLMQLGDDIECFVFIVEDHEDERLTIFVPGSPNPVSGSVQIVPKNRVRPLNVRITDIGTALQQWGVGAGKVLAKDRAFTSKL